MTRIGFFPEVSFSPAFEEALVRVIGPADKQDVSDASKGRPGRCQGSRTLFLASVKKDGPLELPAVCGGVITKGVVPDASRCSSEV